MALIDVVIPEQRLAAHDCPSREDAYCKHTELGVVCDGKTIETFDIIELVQRLRRSNRTLDHQVADLELLVAQTQRQAEATATNSETWDNLQYGTLGDLAEMTERALYAIADAYAVAPNDPTFRLHLITKIGEEAGEALGAYLRAAGWGRRVGTWGDVDEELADVVISAFLAARSEGRDLAAAIEAKAKRIFARGFKEVLPNLWPVTPMDLSPQDVEHPSKVIRKVLAPDAPKATGDLPSASARVESFTDADALSDQTDHPDLERDGSLSNPDPNDTNDRSGLHVEEVTPEPETYEPPRITESIEPPAGAEDLRTASRDLGDTLVIALSRALQEPDILAPIGFALGEVVVMAMPQLANELRRQLNDTTAAERRAQG